MLLQRRFHNLVRDGCVREMTSDCHKSGTQGGTGTDFLNSVGTERTKSNSPISKVTSSSRHGLWPGSVPLERCKKKKAAKSRSWLALCHQQQQQQQPPNHEAQPRGCRFSLVAQMKNNSQAVL